MITACREKLSRCSEAINVGVARCNNYVPEKNPDVIVFFTQRADRAEGGHNRRITTVRRSGQKRFCQKQVEGLDSIARGQSEPRCRRSQPSSASCSSCSTFCTW